MLLTAIGSAVAISAAVLVHGSGPGHIDAAGLLTGLWIVLAVIAEGIFLRLIRVRRSIRRDIRIINLLKETLYERAMGPEKEVLKRILEADGKPPSVFMISATPTSAIIVASSAAFAASWLADSGLRSGAPLSAYVASLGVLIIDLTFYVFAAAQADDPL